MVRWRNVAVLLLALLPMVSHGNGVVKETVWFLKEDGHQYLSYSTVRTDSPSYDLYLDKAASLEDYLYIFPNAYRWDTESDPQANILHFPQSDYATISLGELDARVSVDEEGVYRFESWDGKQRGDGHFGYWTRPEDFSQFVYVWVLPAHFEFVSYQSNRDGEWVQRHNTLAYYGNQVNDLTFTIHYRPRSHATFAAVRASLQDERDAVELVQQEGGVRLTLAETVLFPSGSSRLTARGKKVLVRIVKGILSREGVRVVVSGHSDNIPINKRLKGKYASNWELSAARSLAVVHELEQAGIGGTRLEARAFGPHRPRASNETAAGRAQNRRIELELIEPQ